MFDKVLLPIDLNHAESWETALPMAKRCAGPNGEIHLLGIVHDLGAAMVSSYLPDDFEKSAMEKLKASLAEFASSNAPDAKVHVAHGHVAETILRIADDLDANLVVMTSHPPNDFKTLLIGSNADKVVRHATVPVLVVR
ncbi:MAG: universal stress protein [Roseobacter sp.]